MEANPDTADAVGEQFYRALIKAAKQPSYIGAFTVTFGLRSGSSEHVVTEQLDSVVAMFNSSVSYANLRLNHVENAASIEVELLEPAFTNRYAQYRPINDVKIRDWLGQSSYGRPIKPSSVYTCRIVMKPDKPEVYLAWEDGEELLYRFDGTTSHRYRFFKYLLTHGDMSHSLAALKDESVVPPSTKKLHEFFSKTFMIGALKDRFAIISEKEAIGVRSMASLEGVELISVIRSNLKHLEKAQFRHVVKKLRQEFVNGRSTPHNSADN